MVKLTKHEARKVAIGTIIQCSYCDKLCKSKEEHRKHLKEKHSKFKIDDHTRKRATKDTFNPKEIYNYWYKNLPNRKNIKKTPYDKDVADLVIMDRLKTKQYYDEEKECPIYVHFVHIWDNNKKEYRKFTYIDDTLFGKFQEIVWNSTSSSFVIKGYDKHRRERKNSLKTRVGKLK